MSTKDIKCELCDMAFTTQQEKEEHKKLEHRNIEDHPVSVR